MKDVWIVVLLVVIVGLAAWYVYRQKKRGNGCIGCPHSGQCPSKRGGCSQQHK